MKIKVAGLFTGDLFITFNYPKYLRHLNFINLTILKRRHFRRQYIFANLENLPKHCDNKA